MMKIGYTLLPLLNLSIFETQTGHTVDFKFGKC